MIDSGKYRNQPFSKPENAKNEHKAISFEFEEKT
ncbi:MAG: hypothetical protein ACI8O8_002303 [Oleiphilaceae bacterium]|jgi:hypothetical protein